MMTKSENIIKTHKKPWPTKDAMMQVYNMNLWGGKEYDFYSGSGSHNPEIINPYIQAVNYFLTSFTNPLVVCDLGCGDFNIGKELVDSTKKYIAVDIVPELIARNKQKFKNNNLEFYCLDLSKAELPKGDCALLRQVLQHLSNAEVSRIVDKLSSYQYIILTEHLPTGGFTPNKNIISGQGIRLKKHSGLNLLLPPFNLKIKDERILSQIALNQDKGIIVTTLYTMF